MKLMKYFSVLYILLGIIYLPVLPCFSAEFTIPNPSFEEDVENDGFPDDWVVPKTAHIELSSHASQGKRAAKFTDGYILLQLIQNLDNFAGKSYIVRFQAAGEDDAKLGAILSYRHKLKDGSIKDTES